MSLKIQIYSDYVCPYCMLAEKPLEEAIEGKNVEVEWMPFELRPAPNETLKPEGDYLQDIWKRSVYPMAERMGIPIVLPDVSPQPYTHLAFEGYQFAREHNKAHEYNKRMFRAFFQEAKDIGNIDILTALAEEIGLNGQEYKKALETGKYKKAHQQLLDHAYKKVQIRSVPTFVIGETMVEGVRSKETFEKVILEELQKLTTEHEKGLSCGIDGCE